jgi:hypothetical protein
LVDGGGVFGNATAGSLIVSNQANFGGGFHGGNGGYLTESTVVGNVARNSGGGVYSSGGILQNNIVFYNSSVTGSNYVGGIYSFCCTAPLPPGTSNISSAPLFANLNSGNLRLAPNSPCINAGGGTAGAKDLDGRPRIVGGRIDIGAYEFQGGLASADFIAWLEGAGLATDGSADFADKDNDGMNNWREWRTSTDPNDAASLLRILAPFVANNGSGPAIIWQSVPDVSYFVERSSDLDGETGFVTVQSGILGQPRFTSYTDTTAGDGPFFYRVGVQD